MGSLKLLVRVRVWFVRRLRLAQVPILPKVSIMALINLVIKFMKGVVKSSWTIY